MKSYPHTGRKEHPVDATFWEEAYRKGELFWDHGQPSPGLVDFLKREKWKPGSILVPGCGLGHDCRRLARHGFVVTGVDISPRAVAQAQKLAARESLSIRYVAADCLHLPAKLRGPYDWVFEHTCFCAIDPGLRDRYVRSVTGLLRAGGHFLGVFYNIQPEAGPPFGTTREELVERFRPHFKLLLDTVPRSFRNRSGKELLMLWRKK